ncbi:hypothetical protein O5853_28230, partial [Escherichia coli]|nr:hypothetical protein [Escherichia coli]
SIIVTNSFARHPLLFLWIIHPINMLSPKGKSINPIYVPQDVQKSNNHIAEEHKRAKVYQPHISIQHIKLTLHMVFLKLRLAPLHDFM